MEEEDRAGLFAAIDEIEERQQSAKRGRDPLEDGDPYAAGYYYDEDDDDYPPEEILPEADSSASQPRERNIVRPFGEQVGSDGDEDEEENRDNDDEERASVREDRRRVPANSRAGAAAAGLGGNASNGMHFDSEQEEVGLRKTRELNRHFFAQVEPGEENARTFDLDTEPEEHAAGMILPNVMLDDENLYFRSLFTVLNQMGKETTRLLKIRLLGSGQDSEGRPTTQLTAEDIANCRAWEKYWTIYVIENHYTILGRILRLPIGPGGKEETITCTACLLWEIWRIKVILYHDEMERHRTWKIKDSEFLCERLVNTPGVPLDPPPIEPIAPTEKELEKGNSDKLKQKVKFFCPYRQKIRQR